LGFQIVNVEMSKLPVIRLSSPHMGENELFYVQDVFSSNWIAPLGAYVDGFEKDLAQFTGVSEAAILNSGTSSIHLSLVLLGIKPGDLVLCQSFTFSGSANPITYLGAKPVFIDSERETWNMCPKALENAIESCLKGLVTGKPQLPSAIIPVHLYGMPAQMDEILDVAKRYGIPVVEDAAEALGSFYHGQACGSFGLLGVLSFNGNKIITTSGGGALLSNNQELIQKARFLATQAKDPAPHYQHSEVGYNYRMSNVLAAIGRGQMEVLPQRVSNRRGNYQRYRKYFESWNNKGYDIKFQEGVPGCYSNRWLTCILIDPLYNQGISQDLIRLALEAERIESRPLWKPMHLQPVFRDTPFFSVPESKLGLSESNDLCQYLFEVGICLPSGSNLTDQDFDRIFSVLDGIFMKKKKFEFKNY
jgi:dTDP-4-amino-4,6-dideoxygalactose transaminase